MGDIMGDQPFLKRARMPLDAFIFHGWYLERGQNTAKYQGFYRIFGRISLQLPQCQWGIK
jgi:hypothetical protein